MKGLPSISRVVAAKLGYYVYLYVDPRDNRVFYVGKGKGARALAHLDDQAKEGVRAVIAELESAGMIPRIEILAHGLLDAEVAFRVESAAIDLLGIENLGNAVRGHHSSKGRMSLEEVVALYTRKPARIQEPAILIRISRLYRYGMTAVELYDATRSAWKVGARRGLVELAFAVHEGVVREVYRVEDWLPAGSTFNSRFDGRGSPRADRWEFVGVVAADEVRKRYINRYVGDMFPQGAQNPIAYVNID
jgi:hypothetical protein